MAHDYLHHRRGREVSARSWSFGQVPPEELSEALPAGAPIVDTRAAIRSLFRVAALGTILLSTVPPAEAVAAEDLPSGIQAISQHFAVRQLNSSQGAIREQGGIAVDEVEDLPAGVQPASQPQAVTPQLQVPLLLSTVPPAEAVAAEDLPSGIQAISQHFAVRQLNSSQGAIREQGGIAVAEVEDLPAGQLVITQPRIREIRARQLTDLGPLGGLALTDTPTITAQFTTQALPLDCNPFLAGPKSVRYRIMDLMIKRLERITHANGFYTNVKGVRHGRQNALEQEPDDGYQIYCFDGESQVNGVQNDTEEINMVVTVDMWAYAPDAASIMLMNEWALTDVKKAIWVDHETGLVDPHFRGLAESMEFARGVLDSGLEGDSKVVSATEWNITFMEVRGKPHLNRRIY